jgi:hypothetical protein
MVVGASEMEVCDVLGSISGTGTKDLQKALKHYGVAFEPRLRRTTKADPLCERFPRAILAAKMRNKPGHAHNWHWMLRWDGEIYDPGGWWPSCAGGSRITSALVLTGREGLRW